MATCEECLHYPICEIMSDQYGISKVYPRQCGYFQNSANVVPKSEVAREIFEEIERVLHRHYHDNKITLEDSALLIVSKHSAHHSIAVLLKDISGLKKKYTEEQT